MSAVEKLPFRNHLKITQMDLLRSFQVKTCLYRSSDLTRRLGPVLRFEKGVRMGEEDASRVSG